MQPLLTVNPDKGNKIEQARVFKSVIGACLQHFPEIISWLQNDWCQPLKLLPENTCKMQIRNKDRISLAEESDLKLMRC